MAVGIPRLHHMTEFMRDILHWPPVQQHIHYRTSSIVSHCILGNAPNRLELFIFTSACSHRHSLCSASRGDCDAKCSHCHSRQNRAISFIPSTAPLPFHSFQPFL